MTDKESPDNPSIGLFVGLQGFFAKCKITKAWKRLLVKTDNSVFPQAERVVLSQLHFMKCGSFEWTDRLSFVWPGLPLFSPGAPDKKKTKKKESTVPPKKKPQNRTCSSTASFTRAHVRVRQSRESKAERFSS